MQIVQGVSSQHRSIDSTMPHQNLIRCTSYSKATHRPDFSSRLLAAVPVVPGPCLRWTHGQDEACQDDHGWALALAVALPSALGCIPDCHQSWMAP